MTHGFPLRVPLLCCRWHGQIEGLREMESSLVQRQSVREGPQVEDVALCGTRRMKALKHLLAQVDGERTVACILGAMHRAGTTPLGPHTLEGVEAPEVRQDLFHADLRPKNGKVDTFSS